MTSSLWAHPTTNPSKSGHNMSALHWCQAVWILFWYNHNMAHLVKKIWFCFGIIVLWHISGVFIIHQPTNANPPKHDTMWENWISLKLFRLHFGIQAYNHTFTMSLFNHQPKKTVLLNENIWILLDISLKYVPWGLIDNNPTLVLIMAWRRAGDKPLSEPMMFSLLTHICITRPQWFKPSRHSHYMNRTNVNQNMWFY